MDYLNDDVYSNILDFLGEDNYVYYAGVNLKFRDTYDYKFKSKRTSIKSVVESKSTFKYYLDNNIEDFSHDDLFKSASKFGKSFVMEYLLDNGYEWDHFCVLDAVECEAFDFFKWLHFETDLPWVPENAYAHASSMGKLNVLSFLREFKMGYPDCRCIQHAYNENIAKWYYTLNNKDIGYLITLLIREDDIEKIKSIYGTYTFDNNMLTEACFYGSIGVANFLMFERFIIPTERDLNIANLCYREDISKCIVECWDIHL